MATYYIVENNQQAGPFTLEQLAARGISKDTNVWTEGMANWTPASQVSELQSLFIPQTPQSTPSYQPEPDYSNAGAGTDYSNAGAGTDYNNAGGGTDYNEYVPAPKDYKMQSIILIAVSVFCCGVCAGVVNLVLGIMALLENNKIDGFYRTGNYEAAQAASDKAGKYCKIGFIVFGVGLVLEVIAYIIYFVIIATNS